jgi:putative lipoprotein
MAMAEVPAAVEPGRLARMSRRLWGWSAGLAAALLIAALAFLRLTPAGPPAASRNGATLAGTVVYRERIALPPKATVEVVLEDVSIADRPAVEVARAAVMPSGQVPIPFELTYAPERIEANHRYGVRAAILWPNGARMFVSPEHRSAFDDTATGGMEILVQRVSQTETADTGRRLLFECGNDVFFAVRILADTATLSAPQFLGNESIVLRQTEAASGARYAAGDTTFSSKGDVATLEIGGRTFIDCRLARSGR